MEIRRLYPRLAITTRENYTTRLRMNFLPAISLARLAEFLHLECRGL